MLRFIAMAAAAVGLMVRGPSAAPGNLAGGNGDHEKPRRIEAEPVPVVRGQGFFPVICKLRDGRLGVVLRGGAPHIGVGGRVDFVISADGGKSWSKPITIADGPADDRNPAFGQAGDGALVCLYHVNQNYDDQGNYQPSLRRPMPIYVVRSEDGGKRWTEPALVDQGPLPWGSPYGKILTMPDGSLLANIYGGYCELPGDAEREIDKEQDCSYLFRSADHGKTWALFSRIATGHNETGLVRLASGRLLAALRTATPKYADAVAISHSDDAGRTWSPPQLLTQPSQHPADLLALSKDQVLMTFGHRLPGQGVRAVLSRDGGKTFPADKLLVLCDDATNNDCGYPSSVLLEDGRVLTVYYAVGSKDHPDWGIHCAGLTFRPF